MTSKVPKALKEVWAWKESVYEDIKLLSPNERIEYFRNAREKFLEERGLEKVKLKEGVYKLRKKQAPDVVAEEEKEYNVKEP